MLFSSVSAKDFIIEDNGNILMLVNSTEDSLSYFGNTTFDSVIDGSLLTNHPSGDFALAIATVGYVDAIAFGTGFVQRDGGDNMTGDYWVNGTVSIGDSQLTKANLYWENNSFVIGVDGDTSWTPEYSDDIVAWYDADDEETIEATGNDVDKWLDKSGNGYHLEQNTASKRPQTSTTTIGGKNAIRTQFQDVISNESLNIDMGTSIMIVSVHEYQNSVWADMARVGQLNGSDRMQVRRRASNDRLSYQNSIDGNTGTVDGTTGTTTTGQPFIKSQYYNGTHFGFYIDGDIDKTSAKTGTFQIEEIDIGWQSNGGTDTRHAEFIILDKTDKNTRQIAEGYLAHKWGLTGSLDAGHPYKTDAPQTADTKRIITINGNTGDVSINNIDIDHVSDDLDVENDLIVNKNAKIVGNLTVEDTIFANLESNGSIVLNGSPVCTDYTGCRSTEDFLWKTFDSIVYNAFDYNIGINTEYSDTDFMVNSSFKLGPRNEYYTLFGVDETNNNFFINVTNDNVLVNWTPSEITTTAWYDADDPSTITESSNLVSKWLDKSGNGYHLEQGTSSWRPQTNTYNISGRNTIRSLFQDRITNTSIDINMSSGIMVIGVHEWADSPWADMAQIRKDDGDDVMQVRRRGGNSRLVYQTKLDGVGGTSDGVNGASTADTPFLVSQYQNGTHFKSYLDGTSETSTARTGSFEVQEIEIGWQTNGGTDTKTGEFIILPVTDDETREMVEGYLAHKWGLASELPVSHPYKSNPPQYLFEDKISAMEVDTVSGDTLFSNQVTIGTSSSPENLIMYSPNGTEWSCGPDNTGAWSCV